jgi:hypothetical protein
MAEKVLAQACSDSASGVPIVLVHGNPETDAVWDLLVARLVTTSR